MSEPNDIPTGCTQEEFAAVMADRVRDDGSIDDSVFETYLLRAEHVNLYDTYVAITVDDSGGCNGEVRLPVGSVLALADAIRKR